MEGIESEMRARTPREVLYDWYDRAMRGDRPEIHENEPHCGWYQRRLVRLGPWVEAAIWCVAPTDPETHELTGDEWLACMVAGELRNAVDQWTYLAGNPITPGRYRAIRDERKRLADRYDPNAPIDHLKTPLPF
jgi:hypothetical protein